jgi:hypothetical protein
MRILLVKTSSLGAVIHALTVVGETCRHGPGAGLNEQRPVLA